MGNGAGILEKEVASDIKSLETTEHPKDCNFATVAKTAIIRALRLGESAGKVSRQNRIMLAILLILAVKSDIAGLIGIMVKFFAP